MSKYFPYPKNVEVIDYLSKGEQTPRREYSTPWIILGRDFHTVMYFMPWYFTPCVFFTVHFTLYNLFQGPII